MVLRYHHSDWAKLPGEEDIMDALRARDVPPGDYFMPHGAGPEAMKDPEFIARMTRGPVALITVVKNGPPAMGKALGQWFAFCLLVSLFAAYLTSRALGPTDDYLSVFRFAGTVAFGAYALALIVDSIWYYRKWSTTWKNVFDGFVYSAITAGVFGWLWPGA